MASRKPAKERLDVLLVSKGLFASRTKAQAALMAGLVRVEGHPSPKAGLEVPVDTPISVQEGACPFVSRGGLKLSAALDAFNVSVQARVALDVGASTGGFTDCLLQRGAARVYAVDVGHGQIDERLRRDARVSVFERLHARDLKPGLFDPPPTLAVVDVSFISVTRILDAVTSCLAAPAELIVLIKPQFELEAKKTPKGIVRSEAHRAEAVAAVRTAAAGRSLEEGGLIESPIHGAKGNVEFLCLLRKNA